MIAEGFILLDVDGVLNPHIADERLILPPARAELVRTLAGLGTLVWATTWRVSFTRALGRDLGLPGDHRAIAFPRPIDADQRAPAPTPKLHWVARWLARSVDESAPVVWIDDQLRNDARAWADAQERRMLLLQPNAQTGLGAAHVESARDFLL